jgi:hypothetical protein
MIVSVLGYATLSSLLIIFLWWFFFFEYRKYRVAVLRYHLFAARDELFRRAMDGDLSFNDRAYGMARILINGLIRGADSLSVADLVLTRLLSRRDLLDASAARFRSRFTPAREALSESGKAAVDSALSEIHFCVLSHVLHVSLVLVIPVQFAKAYFRVRGLVTTGYAGELFGTKRVVSKVERIPGVSHHLEEIDDNAFRLGAPTDDLLCEAA